VQLLHAAVTRDDVRGAFNAVAPEPVRSAEFARALGRVLHRPAILPVPAPALQLIFGEMARETLLASTRAVPARLQQWHHPFLHPALEPGLRHLLGR
jgi:NAD dependent epimerase/dehydratase family enzyme